MSVYEQATQKLAGVGVMAETEKISSYVESWKTVSGATVGSGVTEVVYGTVVNAKVTGGGVQRIGSGGVSKNGAVTGDVIYNGSYKDPFGKEYADITLAAAEMVVHSGGSALGTRVTRNGELEVYAGGYVSGAVIGAASCHAKAPAYMSRGVLEISDVYAAAGYARTALAENVTIANGEAYLQGGTLLRGKITGASAFAGIAQNGLASAVTVVSGASLNVGSGGSALACVIGPRGSCVISENGIISGGVVSGGSLKAYGSDEGGEAAYVWNVTVRSGGRETLQANSLASGGVVATGAAQTLEADAQAMKMTVSGTQILAGSHAITSAITVAAGGFQRVNGGEAQATTVKSGGRQIVAFNGMAFDVRVASGGVQTLVSGGYASKVVLSAGASQIISSGGRAINVVARAGATQIVANGGVTSGDTVSAGVKRIILKGGAASSVTVRGSQFISAGGKTSCAVVASGGRETVQSLGLAANTKILRGGRQHVNRGGKAVSAQVSAGGLQVVYAGGAASATAVSAGGWHVISSGGKSVSATVFSGGSQSVYNGALSYRTSVEAGALQFVLRGGNASASIVRGEQRVNAGASSLKTSVAKAGLVRLYTGCLFSGGVISSRGSVIISGGTFKDVTVNAGAEVRARGGVVSGGKFAGTVNAAKGAMIKDPSIVKKGVLNLAAGAKLSLTKTATVYGTLSLSGAAVTGNAAQIKLAAGARLSAQNGANLKSTTLSVGAGSLLISGVGVKLKTLVTAGKSVLTFNLESAAAKTATYALTLTQGKTSLGTLNIKVAALQGAGTYELANNLKRAGAGVLYVNGKRAAALKIGSAVKYGGATYRLSQSGWKLNLAVSLDKGTLYKGTAKNDRLVGGSASDIYYGGKGSDIYFLNGGKDTVVFDKTAWGKDTVAATTGTVTILFAGLKSADIITTKKGADMVITRKGVSGQSVTVRNWNDSTHKIVYGGTLYAFSKFAAAASPMAAQKTAAAAEVWKKCGLLA